MARNAHNPQDNTDLPLFAKPAPTAERDRILAAVERGAGAWFLRSAEVHILGELRRLGRASGESLVDSAKAAGIVPLDDRAFGPVFMRLARQGLIEKCGFVPRKRGHGTSGGNVWKVVDGGAP